MKHFKNTQGSVWLAVLVIIAVVVAALLLSGNIPTRDVDDGIQGRVNSVNQEDNFFTLTHVEVLSVAEDGDAEIEESTYTVLWRDQDESSPDYEEYLEVSSLKGGEMVRVTPDEPLEEGQTIFVLGEITITRDAEVEVDEDTSENETTATSSE